MCIHMYIYIYIYRERERERDSPRWLLDHHLLVSRGNLDISLYYDMT